MAARFERIVFVVFIVVVDFELDFVLNQNAIVADRHRRRGGRLLRAAPRRRFGSMSNDCQTVGRLADIIRRFLFCRGNGGTGFSAYPATPCNCLELERRAIPAGKRPLQCARPDDCPEGSRREIRHVYKVLSAELAVIKLAVATLFSTAPFGINVQSAGPSGAFTQLSRFVPSNKTTALRTGTEGISILSCGSAIATSLMSPNGSRGPFAFFS